MQVKPAPAYTIAAILAHQFVGNYHSDSAACTLITKFFEDQSQPLAHRAQALWHWCTQGMGLSAEECGMHAGYVPGANAEEDRAFVAGAES